MTAKTASQAFVDALAAVVQEGDLTDTVANLLESCAEQTGAAAVGLLVKDGRGRLEVLSATSHQVAELELYQLQHDAGPCVDAAREGTALSAHSDDDITERWGTVGIAIVAAGFHAVQAVPLRWHGLLIGAMNAFHTSQGSLDDESLRLTQAFADIATVVIVHAAALTSSELDERVQTALAGRTVIEQAKGVLAETTGSDMATAYELLVQRAQQTQASLTDAAIEILREGQERH
ncbi:GAF and ANTAR domain-containing protein [Kribbella sp. NBC_00889]|uniref:GAF and ANTAR domain-containing protein n=1 Tax=Kribbella sp. NBC_00889 TaxID=2975974 RepID=UPI00386B1576|nr:GAF and ANTAR domain-containing protein [Kribbella sp. NBC_00889]